MKNWTNATIEELNLVETAYGSSVVTQPDDTFVNAEGNWEATFAS